MPLYGLPPPEPEMVVMRVRMQRTATATLDGGATTRVFEEGQEYDLPEWLAQAFFRGGEADPAEAHAQLASEAAGQGGSLGTGDEGGDTARPPASEKRAKRAK